MNDIQNIHPGKLKRKSKKTSSASVVDIPAVRSDPPPQGNLLGDVILEPAGLKLHSDSIDIGGNSESAEISLEPVISLKPAEPEKHEESPLSKLSSLTDAVKTPSAESRSLSLATDLPEQDFSPTKSKRKPTRAKASEPEAQPQTPDTKKFQDVLSEIQDTNKQCLETLSRLQNNNIQNEKRYALNLIIGFAIVAIIATIGIFAGVNLKNSANTSEFKFKQETYNNAIEARNFLEAKIDELQQVLARNAFDSGLLLYNSSSYEQARDAFFKSLAHNEIAPYTPRLNYYLAMSLYQLGDFEGARRYFALISPSDLNSDMDAEARFYRALAAEKLGDYAEAFEQFDLFLKKYRYHKHSDEAAKHRTKLESARR